jgi:hypothetical protein
MLGIDDAPFLSTKQVPVPGRYRGQSIGNGGQDGVQARQHIIDGPGDGHWRERLRHGGITEFWAGKAEFQFDSARFRVLVERKICCFWRKCLFLNWGKGRRR